MGMRQPPLQEANVRRFIDELVGDELHVKQIDSLTHAVLGALISDRAEAAAIGRSAAHVREVSDKHSIKQVDRFLGNEKVDASRVMRRIVRRVVANRDEIVVAIDWTEFAPDGHSTVSISMVNANGRATPLVWKTVRSDQLKGRRARFEDTALWMLKGALPQDVRVTVLADRGFSDCGLFEILQQKMRFDFVIRFKAGVIVESAGGERRAGGEWVPSNGHARRLLDAKFTNKKQRLPAAVFVKRVGMKDSWCLATSRAEDDPETVVALYSRRFDIEHTFRDQKDRRFGFGLYHVHISTTGRRDRMLLVIVIASMITTLLGAAGEQLGLDRLLRANTQRVDDDGRTHSLWRQGREYFFGVARDMLHQVRATFWQLTHDVFATDRIYAVL
jgi:hypothetical protein